MRDYYVGTEHLLLAIVAAGPAAAEVGGLTPDAVLHAIHEALGASKTADGVLLTPGAQTPRFKLAIQRASDYAVAETRPVSRRDILLALLTDPASECQKVFRHLGLQDPNIRD